MTTKLTPETPVPSPYRPDEGGKEVKAAHPYGTHARPTKPEEPTFSPYERPTDG